MEKEMLRIEMVCEECGNRTKMKFVERKNEYLIYKCPICDAMHKLSERDIEKKTEEEMS